MAIPERDSIYSHDEQCWSLGDNPGLTKAQTEWLRCRHWIQAALDRSPHLEDIEDVERMIGEGRYIFVPGEHSAAVFEIAHFAQKKAFVAVHAGGDKNELMDVMEPMMCALARSFGCDVIMGYGREGWKRETEKRGYRFGWVAMIKDLYA